MQIFCKKTAHQSPMNISTESLFLPDNRGVVNDERFLFS